MAAGWRKFTGSSPYPELTANRDRSSFTYGSKLNRSFRLQWIQGKRDERAEREILNWISTLSGKRLPTEPDEAVAALNDGVVLCQFLQKVNPHALARKISMKPTRFAAVENLANFQDGLVALGLEEGQMFSINELTEKKQLNGLIRTLGLLRHKLGIH